MDQGWVPTAWGRREVEVGDVGDFISEMDSPFPVIAFRADKNGKIHIISRIGVLIGYPGELGTVNLTAADVEMLGVSELKKELDARGVRTTGQESQDRTNLTDFLQIDFYRPFVRSWSPSRGLNHGEAY